MRKSSRNKPSLLLGNLVAVRQSELAKYLGVSPTLLTLYNKKLRNLPSTASKKFDRLLLFVVEQGNNAKVSKQLPSAAKQLERRNIEIAQKLSEKIALQRIDVRICRRELGRLKTLQERQQAWLIIVEKKLADLEEKLTISPEDRETIGDSLWFTIQQDDCSKKLLAIHEKQVALQLKIELMQATADVHLAFRQRLKKGIIES